MKSGNLLNLLDLGGTITRDSIDNLAIKQFDSVIFDLTDNLGNMQTAKALEVLDGLIYNKEPVQKILVTLYNHFKKLYLCNLAIKSNKDIAIIFCSKCNYINNSNTNIKKTKSRTVRKRRWTKITPK